MHSIQAGQTYRIVTVELAIRADSEAETTDGINEMLNAGLLAETPFIVDWRFPELPERILEANENAGEGDLFYTH